MCSGLCFAKHSPPSPLHGNSKNLRSQGALTRERRDMCLGLCLCRLSYAYPTYARSLVKNVMMV